MDCSLPGLTEEWATLNKNKMWWGSQKVVKVGTPDHLHTWKDKEWESWFQNLVWVATWDRSLMGHWSTVEELGDLSCCLNQDLLSVCVCVCVCVIVTQVCPTLCNPMDCNPPGSSVNGILQARILEWVAFSRGSYWPRDQTWVSWNANKPPGKL